MITLPDGTTAQVQGVAQMDPGQGAVHTLAEVASQHSSLEVGHSSDLQENGHIIITGDDGQGRKNIIRDYHTAKPCDNKIIGPEGR